MNELLIKNFNDNGYLNLNLNEYLTETEFSEYTKILDEFKVDLDSIKSSIGFLSIAFDYSNFEETEINFINKIIEVGYITYSDYLKLYELNKKYNIKKDGYFNFMLTSIQQLDNIKYYLNIAYKKILNQLFGYTIENKQNLLTGHMNVYPKGSYIREHRDGDGNATEILCTSLFFLNKNRKYEDGSILVVYDKNDKKIEIVPDYNTIIILNHKNNNLLHEVTENLIDDIRLSLYTPFLEKNINLKIKQNELI